MPVIGVPVSRTIPRRDELRRFLRDFPGPVPSTGVLNVLLDNVEFSDDDVDAALCSAIDWYNALTPQTHDAIDSLPKVVLMYGTAAHLLASEGMRQLRNQATVQDGNVQPIQIDDKQAIYQQWAGWMRQQFMEAARALKTERNMNLAYGNFGSGYRYTSRRIH